MKNRSIKGIFISIATLFALSSSDAKACAVTDAVGAKIVVSACYSCMFPLSVGGIQVVQGPIPDIGGIVGSPICACPFPPPIYVRVGIPVSFFEPSRVVEVVSDPYCFPTFGIPSPATGTGMLAGVKNDGSSSSHTVMQTHYMIFPLYSILEIATDLACVEVTGVDIASITEVDPLWNSDALGAYIAPEALLFGNPLSNLACIADSVTSQFFTPNDALFWCMGSWGNAYPMTGHKPTNDSFVQDTAAMAAKTLYKLHRELILWGSWGQAGLCGYYPAPIWRKSAYRLQIIDPIPHFLATTIGQSGMLWDWGKNPPMMFDNFGFLLFKKRDCCVL